MAIPPSTRFGPYEVLAPLGSGGMGEVYRARDTRLGRDVAIKALPEAFAADPERVARFTREAQVLASLNHPNIAHVYGTEESQSGSTVLVMELVEGDTLEDRLAHGKVPLDDALSIAKQVGAALEAAHEAAIIHRDLKPANIKIRPDGTVKVLDFGLAKLAASADDSRPGLLSQSPTITSPAMMTGVGVLLGTAAYMSPEQARGKPIDSRTDIWSFGAVLYEMVTGRRAFVGEDVADTISRVLQTHPPLDDVPAPVRRLIEKCLQKNPKDRLRDVGDAWELLDRADNAPHPSTNRATRVWQGVAALLAVAAAVTAWAPWRQAAPSAPVIRFQIVPPPGTTFANDVDDPPAVSPDGTQLAFLAMSADGRIRIWVRALRSLDARQLEGTEEARWVLWSPNGKWIGYESGGGELRRVPVAGGPPQTICVCDTVLKSAWSPTGVLVFGSSRGLFQVPEEGGTPTSVTTVDPTQQDLLHLLPSFLPDGRHLVFLRAASQESGRYGLYSASLDAKPGEQPLTRILDTFAQYGSGRLLFIRSGILLSQPFDVDAFRLTGESSEIARLSFQVLPPTSGSGVLAYGVNPSPRQLTWLNASGKPIGTIGPPANIWNPRVSPDDEEVAFTRYDSGPGNVWLFDQKRGIRQFTGGFPAENPLWLDAAHIAYTRIVGGGFQFVQRAINGVGLEEPLFQPLSGGFTLLVDTSRDHKYGIFVTATPKTRTDVSLLAFETKRSFPYLSSPSNENQPRLSPNGKWLAYASDAFNRFDVYVDTFSGTSTAPGASRGHWQISAAGGTRPVWSRDGKRLFFINLERKMMSVTVRNTEGAVFEFDPPVPLFDVRISGNPLDTFDVTTDGRFLMPVPSEQRASEPITVIVNWPAATN